MSTVITAGNATNGLSFTADNAGAFDFKTGTGAGTSAMTIDSSQNVSIPKGVGGTPAFSAYCSSQFPVTIGVFTKLQFQTEEFDTTNAFDSTTNYRFQPAVAGYYQVNGGYQTATSSTQMLATIYKNGTEYKRGIYIVSGNVYVSALVYLNGTTDYIELYGYIGATQNILNLATITYFQASMTRGA